MVQADGYHLGQHYLQKGQATIDHYTRSDTPWAKGLANLCTLLELAGFFHSIQMIWCLSSS